MPFQDEHAGTPGARLREMERRMRRVRRLGIAGTLAAIGVFSGLAAAGDRDGIDAPPAAAPDGTTVIPPQTDDGLGQAYPGGGSVDGYSDPSPDGDYLGSAPGGAVGPGSWSGPPDAFSGAS